jgi:hypothetical protein
MSDPTAHNDNGHGCGGLALDIRALTTNDDPYANVTMRDLSLEPLVL